jgi:hypothetical protein
MACFKFVEAAFGPGLVTDTIMYYREVDLIGDLPKLLSDVFAVYAGHNYETMFRALKAKNAIVSRLPESLDGTSFSTFRVLLALSSMSESKFVAHFTDDELSFADKLKAKKIMRLMLEVKDNF